MKRLLLIRSVVFGLAIIFLGFSMVNGQDCTSDGMYRVFKDDIDKTREQAEEYKPGLRNYFVQDFNDRKNVYLRAAISPTQRAEFMKRFAAAPELGKCINKLIDELAVVIKRTLPTYTPTGYTARTPAEDKLLRGAVSDAATATVFRTGLEGPNWRIDKNEYGIPTARFKYGMMYAKFPSSDDGFCRIVWINIVQQYAGGGTYGASVGNFIKSEPAGCPPGK